jgi:hypothetical protein
MTRLVTKRYLALPEALDIWSNEYNSSRIFPGYFQARAADLARGKKFFNRSKAATEDLAKSDHTASDLRTRGIESDADQDNPGRDAAKIGGYGAMRKEPSKEQLAEELRQVRANYEHAKTKFKDIGCRTKRVIQNDRARSRAGKGKRA